VYLLTLLSRYLDFSLNPQREKIETQQAFMAEKQALMKKQDVLRAKIAEKEKERDEQVKLTKVQGTRAQEFWQRHAELENEVATLRNKLKQTEDEWEKKANQFQADRAQERRDTQAKHARVEAEAQKKIDAAVSEANELKAAFEKTRREKDDERVQYCKTIGELETQVKNKAKEIESMRQLHSQKLQQMKLQSDETLKKEQTAAISKQKELISRIEEKDKDIRERDALTNLEKAKSKDLWGSRAKLEGQMKALKTEHAQAILEWENKYQAIRKALEDAQRAASDDVSRKQDEARKQIEAALAEAASCRAKLKEGLQAKDAQHETEVKTLRELSRRAQKELSGRLAVITEEFNEYKFEMQKRLAAQEEQDKTASRRQLEVAAKDKERLTERIKNDFTSQLVKREVDLLRQKALLKEKDAEIAALKGESDRKKLQVKLDLSNVKKKVSRILRRDYNEKTGMEDLSGIQSKSISETEKRKESPAGTRRPQ